jgi:hypothetical protein
MAEALEAVIREWAQSHLVPGTLAVLWCGPAARGFADADEDLDVRFVLDDDTYAHAWQGGRRRLRDVAGGRVLAGSGLAFSQLAATPWDAERRFTYGRARLLWEGDGRVAEFVRARLRLDAAERQRDCLAEYLALRGLWRDLLVQLRRRDRDAVALVAAAVAEAAMRLHFALQGGGRPRRSWLWPEFRAAAPPAAWTESVTALLHPAEEGELRRAAACLVELGRDAIHDAFAISRGRLDALGALQPSEPA